MNSASKTLAEAAKREAEIESGKVTPLTESEFRTETDAACQEISERDSIRLSESESQRFVEALLAAPSKPTQRFFQALKIYQSSVVER